MREVEFDNLNFKRRSFKILCVWGTECNRGEETKITVLRSIGWKLSFGSSRAQGRQNPEILNLLQIYKDELHWETQYPL